MKVAVVAHSGKSIGGGLGELRAALARRGAETPWWYEVDKSKYVPTKVRKAVDKGAELVVVWGGDGTVQRAVDVLSGTDVTMAVIPAGTANLFASNLGIPSDIERAVEIGLGGAHKRLDVATMNGERFAVMAGVGFDALMINDADRGAKDRFGRLAYVWAGARHINDAETRARIEVDGVRWFDGQAACVLFGNVGTLMGGVEVFPDARPDDGAIELGVLSAQGAWQWTRLLARAAVGHVEKSPLVQTTAGRKIVVELASKRRYELDGGARGKTDRLKVKVIPGALSVAVPTVVAA